MRSFNKGCLSINDTIYYEVKLLNKKNWYFADKLNDFFIAQGLRMENNVFCSHREGNW